MLKLDNKRPAEKSSHQKMLDDILGEDDNTDDSVNQQDSQNNDNQNKDYKRQNQHKFDDNDDDVELAYDQ